MSWQENQSQPLHPAIKSQTVDVIQLLSKTYKKYRNSEFSWQSLVWRLNVSVLMILLINCRSLYGRFNCWNYWKLLLNIIAHYVIASNWQKHNFYFIYNLALIPWGLVCFSSSGLLPDSLEFEGPVSRTTLLWTEPSEMCLEFGKAILPLLG